MKPRNRHVLIVHDYISEPVAKSLYSIIHHEGVTFSLRNERWGYLPSQYALVLVVGNFFEPNSLSEKEKGFPIQMFRDRDESILKVSEYEHYDKEAKKIAEFCTRFVESIK